MRTTLCSSGPLLLLFSTLVAGGAAPASSQIFHHGTSSKKPAKAAAPPPVALRALTPEQSTLVDRAVGREAILLEELRSWTPIVETYIQDPAEGNSPAADHHFLRRVSLRHTIDETLLADSDTAKADRSPLHKMTHLIGGFSGAGLRYNPAGFSQMMVMDSRDFNRDTYKFAYVGPDTLGSVPTEVFDVQPLKKHDAGRFTGQIWVERRAGNVVRASGVYLGSSEEREYMRFDTWRTNVQKEIWLPATVYAEYTPPKAPQGANAVKAISFVWGYSLKGGNDDASQSELEIVGANDASATAADNGPLRSARAWVQQAEDNLVDHLYMAGLIDAPSQIDETLTALANKMLAVNGITVSSPVKVRTLLTETLESTSAGSTILISKGLLDTTGLSPTDGDARVGMLQAIVAFQLAHVLLGHRISTDFSFHDPHLWSGTIDFSTLQLHHSEAENAEAGKRAAELLSHTEFSAAASFGGYLSQVGAHKDSLRALTTPAIGDGLMTPSGGFWMQASGGNGSAVPLGAGLLCDPWTDRVMATDGTGEGSAFAVQPVTLKLNYAPTSPDAPRKP